MSDTCDYVAGRDDPGSWQGEDSDDWLLAEESWSCPHPTHEDAEGGSEYCLFHMDPEKRPNNVDETDELLAEITHATENADHSSTLDGDPHRAQFVGATFVDLDLSERELASTDACDIRFDHALFSAHDESLRFDGVTIEAREQLVSFAGATFETTGDGDVTFEDAKFRATGGEDLVLENATFSASGTGDVRFASTTFESEDGDIKASDVTFVTRGEGDVIFDDGGRSFSNRGGAEFVTKADSYFDFVNASFVARHGGDVRFQLASFDTEGNGNLLFNGATFAAAEDGDVVFEDATFNGDGGDGDGVVVFRDAEFQSANGHLRFGRSRFQALTSQVIFENATFRTTGSGRVEFQPSNFVAEDAQLSFEDATFGTAGHSDVMFHDSIFRTGRASITFEDATFGIGRDGQGTLDFANTEFTTDEGDISFHDTQFTVDGDGEGDVTFEGAHFETEIGDISFEDTRLIVYGEGDGSVLFKGVELRAGRGTIDFTDSRFRGEGEGEEGGDVDWRQAKFLSCGGIVRFEGARFHAEGDGHTRFEGVDFGIPEVVDDDENGDDGNGTAGTADGGSKAEASPREDGTTPEQNVLQFEGARFTSGSSGNVNFRNVTFGVTSEELDFSNTQFAADDTGDVDFYNTMVQTETGTVDFSHSRFAASGNGNVNFSEVTIQTETETVDFSHTRFDAGVNGTISFAEAKLPTGKGEVAFTDARFTSEGRGQLTFDECSVDGCCSFEEAAFDVKTLFTNLELDPTASSSFARTRFSDRCEFGTDDGVIPGELDFTGARFDRSLTFQKADEAVDDLPDSLSDEKYPFVDPDRSDRSERPRLAFVNAISFERAKLPDNVDFSATRFPPGTTFDGAELSGANFSNADLAFVSLEQARLNRAELLGTNLVGAKLYGTMLGDAAINTETSFWQTSDNIETESLLKKARRRWPSFFSLGDLSYCIYDYRFADTKGGKTSYASDSENLQKATEVYSTLESTAKYNSMPNLLTNSFLGRKDVQRRQYRQEERRGMWLRSVVPNLVARYGESIGRVVFTGVVVVLSFAVIYRLGGLVESADDPGEAVGFLDSLYFSALTFSTLGYGDFNPLGTFGRVTAIFETALGVTILAILVFVFSRRATR